MVLFRGAFQYKQCKMSKTVSTNMQVNLVSNNFMWLWEISTAPIKSLGGICLSGILPEPSLLWHLAGAPEHGLKSLHEEGWTRLSKCPLGQKQGHGHHHLDITADPACLTPQKTVKIFKVAVSKNITYAGCDMDSKEPVPTALLVSRKVLHDTGDVKNLQSRESHLAEA